MPVMRWRVVCALREVMLIFWPTSALSKVDLPTLGLPTMAIEAAALLAGFAHQTACQIKSEVNPSRVLHRDGTESVAFRCGVSTLSRINMAAAAACSPARRDPPMPRSVSGEFRHLALDLEGLLVRRAERAGTTR